MISSILAGLIGAIVVGVLAYAIVKVAFLTFSVIKDKIKEKLNQKPGTISKGAVVSVQTLLDNAPELSVEDFGPKVEEEDYLIFGIKQDDTLDEEVDIIRAERIDDQLSDTMDNYGGIIKLTK